MTQTTETISSETHACECGEIYGEKCEGEIEGAPMTVEVMPEYLRESHRAAGNSGEWPHNGSIHIRCCSDCAQRLLGTEEGWAEIV